MADFAPIGGRGGNICQVEHIVAVFVMPLRITNRINKCFIIYNS